MKGKISIAAMIIATLIISTITSSAAAWREAPIDPGNPTITVRCEFRQETRTYNMTFPGNSLRGTIVIDGQSFDVSKSHTVDNRLSYEGCFISGDAVYQLHCISEMSPGIICDPSGDHRYSAPIWTNELELVPEGGTTCDNTEKNKNTIPSGAVKNARTPDLEVRAAVLMNKSGDRSVTVRWKAASKSVKKKISGYEVQISAKPDFSKAKTYRTGRNAVSKTIRNLGKGKKYYIRIRALRGNVHGNWSEVRSVLTKK